ncbi:hypothetical protein HMPREF1982_02431 [Clostridiales bacterium oral taxon 876 str. F0540]|nr:hypothetical protein HMPREF1982_02431 [Clostridiales bacterium oral taxon 876 str. F0540]
MYSKFNKIAIDFYFFNLFVTFIFVIMYMEFYITFFKGGL